MANYQSYKQIQGDAAVIPSSLGPGQVVGLSTGVAHQFFVFNGNHYDGCNGGCCLLWTVPARATTVRFELTGGGGSGAPGVCCANGPGGGSGSYATKTIFEHCNHFTPGSSRYTICSGGSGYCACCGYSHAYNCCGTKGCTSFVTPVDGGAGGMSNFCAQGGSWGWHQCDGGCYSCSRHTQCNVWVSTTSCPNNVCGCHGSNPGYTNGSTSFGIPGVQGRRYNNSYCRGSTSSWTGPAVGPWTVNAPGGDDSCSVGTARGCCRGHAIFPGGGGHSPFNDGGCCWGGFGQGGLVVVSYWE